MTTRYFMLIGILEFTYSFKNTELVDCLKKN